jgi:hypothetical protein
MTLQDLTNAATGVNLCALKLALDSPRRARGYLSYCLRKFDDMTGRGLPQRDPLNAIVEQGWGVFSPEDRVELPVRLNDGGGTSLHELLILASATRLLQPAKIFEIGTFNGRTTSAFILNAPPAAEVVTLDLPPASTTSELAGAQVLKTDLELIKQRQLGSYLHTLQLEDRCQQVFCDSLEFDPTPHLGTVELGFIDGAHTQPFVENDTRKMAAMMSERGLVFWHDYGGKGAFRSLSVYLEALARQIPFYRVSGTTLAWAKASDLRKLVDHDWTHQVKTGGQIGRRLGRRVERAV